MEYQPGGLGGRGLAPPERRFNMLAGLLKGMVKACGRSEVRPSRKRRVEDIVDGNFIFFLSFFLFFFFGSIPG